MKTLYEISNEMMLILEQAQEEEISQEELDAMLDSLNLRKDLNTKVENYWAVIDELEASNERIKAEVDRLQDRRRTQSANIRRMKDTLRDALTMMDVEKIKTDKSTIWIQNNPQSIEVQDVDKIPKEYFEEQLPKLKKSDLLRHIKATGEVIPGVTVSQTRGIRRK